MLDKLYKALGLNPESKLAQYLLKGGSASFAIHITYVFIAFVSSFVLTRTLGDEYGRYVYGLNIASLLMVFAMLGFTQFIIRETAKYSVDKNYANLSSLFKKSNLICFTASIVVCIIAWLIIENFNLIDEVYKSVVKISLLAVPFWTLLVVNQSMLRGSKNVIAGQLSEKIYRPIILLVLLVGFYFYNTKVSGTQAIQLYVLSFAVVMVILFFLVRKNLPMVFQKHEKQDDKSILMFKSLATFYLMDLVFNFNGRVDIISLGEYRTELELGYYNIALKLSEFIKMFLLIVNLVIAPEIAALHKAGNIEKLQILLTRSIRWTFFGSLILALALIVSGKFILPYWGQDYVLAYSTLVIMCIVQMVNVSMGSVGNVLAMTGNERISSISLIISLIANIAFNIYLVPKRGIEGAAIATGISVVIWNVLMWAYVKVKLKLDTSIFKF